MIDAGGVTELGGHDELMRGEGLYAELFQLQVRAYQGVPEPAPGVA